MHEYADGAIIIGLAVYGLKFGIEWFRSSRNSSGSGNGKPSLLELKDAIRESREKGVGDVKDSFKVSLEPVVTNLRELKEINGTMKDALIEFLAWERGRNSN